MGRSLLFILISLAAIGALAGCQKGGESAGMTGEPVAVSLDRPSRLETDDESTRGSELANLIQRDVDEYLRRREQIGGATPPGNGGVATTRDRNQTTETANVTDSDVGEFTPADERPFWERPGRIGQPPPEPVFVAPPSSTQDALRDAGVGNNPLFRDPESIDVRPFENGRDQTESDGSTDARIDGGSLESLLTSLRAELYQDASRSDMPLRELLMIAAMSMIDPGRAMEPDAIPDLTDDERELLGKLQQFFAGLGSALDGTRPSEEVIEEAVAGLRSNLLNLPQFEVQNAAFCWSVDAFGLYEEVPRYAFLAHNSQQVILYVEVDGFASERDVEGDWVTKISQKLTILTQADGVPVWQDDWRTSTDKSAEQRHDFYTTQIITLPEALSVGSYVLKVRLRDEANGTESEKSIPFTLVADPRMAASLK